MRGMRMCMAELHRFASRAGLAEPIERTARRQ